MILYLEVQSSVKHNHLTVVCVLSDCLYHRLKQKYRISITGTQYHLWFPFQTDMSGIVHSSVAGFGPCVSPLSIRLLARDREGGRVVVKQEKCSNKNTVASISNIS